MKNYTRCFFYFLLFQLNLTFFVPSFARINESLDPQQQSLVIISAHTAIGNLQELKIALNEGLESGLTINEIKEALVHLYAYCGFPRSIRGLQTFMEVLEERKSKGKVDPIGRQANAIDQTASKYTRGKKVLETLTNTPQPETLSGYGAFAPVMDTFLKEHLFADIFERDILTYAQRELVTISVLSALGGVEPMLRSHFSISLHVGFNPDQLNHFIGIIQGTLGSEIAGRAQVVLREVLNNKR